MFFLYGKSVWTVIARFPHCLSLTSEEEYDVLLLSFSVQEALSNLEDYDKTCVESALQGVSNVVQQEWGSACPCQVLGVLFTTSSHLNPLLFRYNWRMDKTFFPVISAACAHLLFQSVFMYLHPLSCRWCWLQTDLLVLERVPYVTPCKHWSIVGTIRSSRCLSLSLPKCTSCV